MFYKLQIQYFYQKNKLAKGSNLILTKGKSSPRYALRFVYYIFSKTINLGVTPAMKARLTKDVMSIEGIVALTN